MSTQMTKRNVEQWLQRIRQFKRQRRYWQGVILFVLLLESLIEHTPEEVTLLINEDENGLELLTIKVGNSEIISQSLHCARLHSDFKKQLTEAFGLVFMSDNISAQAIEHYNPAESMKEDFGVTNAGALWEKIVRTLELSSVRTNYDHCRMAWAAFRFP